MFDDGSKTEKATPKRREEARKKGQVARSMELSTAFVFITGVLILRFYIEYIWKQIQNYSYYKWAYLPTNLNVSEVYGLFIQFFSLLALLIAPILAILFIVTLVVVGTQVQFKLSPDVLKPDITKLNPINGFKRFFSLQPYVQLAQSILKLILFTLISYWIFQKNYPLIVSTMNMDISQTGQIFAAVIWEICWKIGLLLLLIGIIDMAYQKYQFEKSIMMTKQEVKDEMKNIEGDPLIKGEIKKKQRQLARKRMLQEIPKADVVVTNPIHYAIAIKYDAKSMSAPNVVAKGAGFLAEKIKEIAKEHRVPIVENPPLAQSLYKLCEVGEEIPVELYAAVSELLVHVYKLTGKI